jgi:hypothetical protein
MEMYRAIAMIFWLPQAEAALAQVVSQIAWSANSTVTCLRSPARAAVAWRIFSDKCAGV